MKKVTIQINYTTDADMLSSKKQNIFQTMTL